MWRGNWGEMVQVIVSTNKPKFYLLPITRNQKVGVRGFEPPTSSSRTTRANRAALHPEYSFVDLIIDKISINILISNLKPPELPVRRSFCKGGRYTPKRVRNLE